MFGRNGCQTGTSGGEGLGSVDGNLAKFLGGREILQIGKPEVFEKERGRTVERRATDDFGFASLFDQSAFEQFLHRAIHRDAPNLLDLRTRDRLAISHDGHRFQGGCRKAGGSLFFANQSSDPGGVVGFGGELPRSGNFDQAITTGRLLIITGHFLKHFGDLVRLDALEFLDLFVVAQLSGGIEEYQAKVLGADGFLGREEQGLEN